MTFTGSALALAKGAVAKWVSVHGSESLDQQCQRYSGYYVSWVYQGNEGITTYASAKLAAKASKIITKDVNAALVGDYIYWSAGADWHIGNVIGHDISDPAKPRALVAYATRYGDTVAELGSGVKVSHADTYKQGPVYGVSRTNGANKALTGITASNIGAPVTATQRTVRADKNANIRSAPSTAGSDLGNLTYGSTVDMDAYVNGQNVTANGITSNVWYKIKGKSQWAWAGGFTSQAVAGLTKWPTAAMRQAGSAIVSLTDGLGTGKVVATIPAYQPVSPIGYCLDASKKIFYVFGSLAAQQYGIGASFTEAAPHDLLDLTPVAPTPPVDPTPPSGSLSDADIAKIAAATAALIKPQLDAIQKSQTDILAAIKVLPVPPTKFVASA